MTGAKKDDELAARIDAELRRALAATPSPEFLAQVRARVAGAPASSWRAASWWIAPAGLAAVAVVVVALQFRGDAPRAPMSPAVATDTAAPVTSQALGTLSGDPAPIRPKPEARRPRPDGRGPKPEARSPRHETPAARHPKEPELPEVLVSRADAIAVERFVAGLAQGRIDASAWANDATPAGRPARINIAPIDIRPLTPY